jgi:hypothetical protein
MMSDDNFDLDEFRQRSERRVSAQEDVDYEEDENAGGGLLGQFTPMQRLILAVLVLANIVVIGFVVLSIAGVL